MPGEGLPSLPDFVILLLKGRNPQQPVTDALADHIAAAFAARDTQRSGTAVASLFTGDRGRVEAPTGACRDGATKHAPASNAIAI